MIRLVLTKYDPANPQTPPQELLVTERECSAEVISVTGILAAFFKAKRASRAKKEAQS